MVTIPEWMFLLGCFGFGCMIGNIIIAIITIIKTIID